jgi:pyruvate,water dikinase
MSEAARPWVYFFGDPLPKPVEEMKPILGGKGASLAAMSLAGLPVPPGFTISAECCRHVETHGGRWPEGLEAEVRANLARLESVTGRPFGRGGRPLLVSVRSGAAVSMPGMMDTILNCGVHPGLAEVLGDTPQFWRVYIQFVRMFAETVAHVGAEAFAALPDPAHEASRQIAERHLAIYRERTGREVPAEPWAILAECIDAVFRSWNNERAVAYRERNNVRGLLGTAVNVQAMFPSRVSGIAFTRDPTDPLSGRMVIEASYGLGEAIVSGAVTPDRFFVSRKDPAEVQTVVGKKVCVVHTIEDGGVCDPDAPSLTPAEVQELAALALRVEAYFGAPADIEWGYSQGRFVLLQSRPIRGLEVAEDVEEGRQEEISRLRELAGNRRRVWVAHNLGETLRAPTPLTWDITCRFMSGSGGFGRMYQDLGYSPSDLVRRKGFLELICGRIYADPERQAQMFWDAVPMTYDPEAVIEDKRVLDRAPTKFDPEKADGRFLARLPRTIGAMIRASRRFREARRRAKERFETAALPSFLAYVHAERERDLAAMGSKELLALLSVRQGRVLDEFGPESLKPGFFGGMALDRLEGILGQLMGREAGARVASDLTSGLEGDVTFEQDALLWDAAAGKATLGGFLGRFGHRALGEMELAEPRWREDPKYLEQLVASLKAGGARSPHDIHEANVGRRKEAEARLPEMLREWGASSLREDVRSDLAEAQTLLPYREAGKHYLMMGYELLRSCVVELGRRWDLGSDVFFLRLDELDGFEGGDGRLREAIAARKVRWQSAQRLAMPDVIDSSNLARLGLPEELKAATLLEGEPVAAGIATGPARIVFDPRRAGDLGTGYVLVCPSTDPGWTTLFLRARGLVVERGGILSHGAIVARDFGIPAVVCPQATSRIRPGDRLRVDGNRGRIEILAQE